MSSDPNKTVKVLFACLDWRLHPAIENHFTADGTGCDMCVTAGSIKALIEPATRNYLIEQVNISKNLHDCKGVVLTMHIDCGAYGGSKAYENMDKEAEACEKLLKQAKEIINANFPELPVETYIVGLERAESGWNIKPQSINL